LFSAEGLAVPYFFTSLNDHYKDGEYYWESTGQLLAFNNWDVNHPQLKSSNNCTVLGAGNINASYKGKWQTTNCNSARPYICEKEDLICVNNPPDY
jgi:Lectin C-type domain